MKINSKAELKALIKECLVEILSDGVRSAPIRHTVRTHERSPKLEQAQDYLPESIPQSMRSLFSDSVNRSQSQLYQDITQVEKTKEVLGEMADQWSEMAFNGAPLPVRGNDPSAHGGISSPPATASGAFGMSGVGSNFEDDFDPYEAVAKSIPRRR